MTTKIPGKILGPALLLGASFSAQAEDLLAVLQMAADNDPQLRAAAATLESTREIKTQAWANFLPNITASGSLTEGDSTFDIGGIEISDSDTDQENLRLELRQTIYDHANYARLDQARLQIAQAMADYDNAYQNLLLRTVDRYLAVLTAEDALRFAEAEEKANSRQLEQAEQRYEVGLTAITDVHEARASYDRSRANVIVAQNTLDDAYEALVELTGRTVNKLDPLKEDYPLVRPDPDDMTHWVDTALQMNPVILSNKLAADIAHENVRLQRAGHYPTVDATVSYNEFTNNEFLLRDDFQQVIGTTAAVSEDTQIRLTLTVPIYAGGSVRSRTRQAAFDHDAAVERLEQQRRATMRQVRSDYRAVIAGISQVEAFKQAVVSSQSALEATEAGFEVGTRTIVDVLIAQRQLFQSQSDYSRARHDLVLNHVRLRTSAGTIEQSHLQRVNDALQ